MDALVFTQALDHARRTLAVAQTRIVPDEVANRSISPGHEDAEQRVREGVAVLAASLDEEPTRESAPKIETLANELDRELARLDVIDVADEHEGI